MSQISNEQIVDVIRKVTGKYGFKIDYPPAPCLPGGIGYVTCYNPDEEILLGFGYSLEKEFIYMWKGKKEGKPTNAKEKKLDFNNLEESLDEVLSE